jgi:hypothetical protein
MDKNRPAEWAELIVRQDKMTRRTVPAWRPLPALAPPSKAEELTWKIGVEDTLIVTIYPLGVLLDTSTL